MQSCLRLGFVVILDRVYTNTRHYEEGTKDWWARKRHFFLAWPGLFSLAEAYAGHFPFRVALVVLFSRQASG